MRNVRSAVVVSCSAAMLFATPAWSQTFTGVVTDSAGHVIPGAEARLAAMDLHAVATVNVGANGRFSVTAPRATAKPRRYLAELCAPGHAPLLQMVPLAASDTLIVRGALPTATTRILPLGTGACGWDARPNMQIIGGHGFGVEAARTTRMLDSIDVALPRDDSARAASQRALRAAWLRKLHAAGDARARARAGWVLLQLVASSGDTADPKTLREIRRTLPPTSVWWQVGSSPFLLRPAEALFGVDDFRHTSAATLAARRAARDYIAAISSATYDPDIDAHVQQELALYDLGMHDSAAVARRVTTLLTEYPGYTGTKLAMFRFRWLTPLRDGAPMPQFDFATLPGAAQPRLTNRDLTAPYTLVVFWGTWCVHCIEELPTLDSLHAEYGKRGFDIVSVAADDSPDVAQAFVRKHDMPWRQAYAGTTEDPLLQKIGVLVYPTSVLIDSTGTILASATGSADLRSTVERFLTR